ncbi:hypothetical protein ACFX13_025185 [Malus domestica]
MAAVSCVASLHQIRTGEKVILSPQDVINHVPGDENGYYIPNIYRFIKVAGVGLEVDIPYGAPRSPTQIGHRVYIHGQRVVKGAKDILEVLERHPVVCIVSGEESLSKYAGGIYRRISGKTRGVHYMLLVGRGVCEEGEYWIVKNSWGPKWGEDGYIRILKEDADEHGVAGINQIVYFPVIFTQGRLAD